MQVRATVKLAIEDLWREAGFTPNDAQHEAILHVDGPLYLPAGPGSGKTKVLLWRALNLLVFHGVRPEEIFLSTFTEKAAFQLKEGLRALLGQVTNHTGVPYDLSIMYIGTLHSLCQRLILDRRFYPNRHRGRALYLQTYGTPGFTRFDSQFDSRQRRALMLGRGVPLKHAAGRMPRLQSLARRRYTA